jgi:hypothetical protein
MLPATEFSPVLGNGGYDFLERDAQFLCLDDQLLDFASEQLRPLDLPRLR